MVNLTMSGQYFSLETMISGIYAKFPIRMMLSPNSTLYVRMDFSLPEWSLDYTCPGQRGCEIITSLCIYIAAIYFKSGHG